jgi:hypothetical protein
MLLEVYVVGMWDVSNSYESLATKSDPLEMS